MLSQIKTMGERGEIVIPKEMREEKGLGKNSKVEVVNTKNAIMLIPLREKLSDFAGFFGTTKIKDMKELDAITHELLAGI